jgi:RNA polymerase sigma-70 factor (ECF subfamily)
MAADVSDVQRWIFKNVFTGGISMTSLDVFDNHRPLLFSIAYRMLGSASDAEDVVQDAWMRYSSADPNSIRSPKSFATTIVTRLCLDRLKSARATREEYIGPWLPEPVLTADTEAPDETLARAESVTLAFLVLLETLSPEERAVFILKEACDCDHAEIAATLGISVEGSRQLLHRAKQRVAAGRSRLTGTSSSRREAAGRFARALISGDGERLKDMLAADVGLWTDGGGKVLAARRPLLGRDEVVKFLVGLYRTGFSRVGPEGSLELAEVNDEPAFLMRLRKQLDSVYVMTIEDDLVSGIRIIRNPDKLAYIESQLATRRTAH